MDYMVISVFAAAILVMILSYFGVEFIFSEDSDNLASSSTDQRNELFIPPLLEGQSTGDSQVYFELKASESTHSILPGEKTTTFGYNGEYLGPTIKIRRGENVTIQVTNQLNQNTTVHWHGLLVDSENDGGPHNIIPPGEEWTANFTVNQPAAPLIYHPHPHGNTGYQIYMGLAGMLIIEDEVSDQLNIPKEYGENDIPIILQDRKFDQNNQFIYLSTMQDVMMGMLGDTPVINGVANPYLNVKTEIIRLRISNVSNARIYNLSFSNDEYYYVIATDGGFLENSLKKNTLPLSPGERIEILIDLSSYEVGDELSLTDDGYPLVTLVINQSVENSFEIPDRLTEIQGYNEQSITRTRHFDMLGMGHMVNINGVQFNMDRIDEYVDIGEVEKWVVRNLSMMGHGRMMGGMGMMNDQGSFNELARVHSFHVHSTQFLVLERNGNQPMDYEEGWKDTVLLSPGETVTFITRFDYPGNHYYHCHNVEHSDSGMMGQFLVE